MSVVFNVVERLSIPKVDNEHEEFLDRMQFHISQLVGYSISGDARLHKFEMETEIGSFTRTHDDSLKVWKETMACIKECKTINLKLSYTMTWYAGINEMDIDPLGMQAYLEFIDKEENPELLDTMCYELFRYADSEPGSGTVYAYGTRNGKHYCGEVPFTKIDYIPQGSWYDEETSYCVEEDSIPEKDYKDILEACRNIQKYAECSDIQDEENGFSFFINNLTLNNEEEVSDFAKQLSILMRFYDNENLPIEFNNFRNDDLVVLRIIFYQDGNYAAEIAKTDE